MARFIATTLPGIETRQEANVGDARFNSNGSFRHPARASRLDPRRSRSAGRWGNLLTFDEAGRSACDFPMTFTVESEREEDGRWIAEIPDLPGVLAYGNSADEARAKVQALALRVLADRIEHGEVDSLSTICLSAA
jgi:predicted RNase H-like HicB family nuclease